MNAFSQFLLPENIFLGLTAPSKMQALAEIAAALERQHQMDRGLIYESLCRREQLGSTGLGEGVAIPHAQIKGLRQPMTAFARLDSPVDFNAPDSKPVSEIFVLLVPRDTKIEHLQMLAELSEMLCDEQFRYRLHAAVDPGSVMQLFCEMNFSAAQ